MFIASLFCARHYTSFMSFLEKVKGFVDGNEINMSPFYGWKTKAQRLVQGHSVGKSQDIKQTLSFSSVQCSRLVQHPSLCDPMDCSTPGLLSFTNFRSLLTLMPIELVMPSNHLILCRPLLLRPSIFPSIRVFSNESVLYIRWPKYWSFIFNISPSNEYSRLISFRIDWFDLLVSPKSSQESSPTPQFKSINSSVLSFLYSPTLNIHTWLLEKPEFWLGRPLLAE